MASKRPHNKGIIHSDLTVCGQSVWPKCLPHPELPPRLIYCIHKCGYESTVQYSEITYSAYIFLLRTIFHIFMHTTTSTVKRFRVQVHPFYPDHNKNIPPLCRGLPSDP